MQFIVPLIWVAIAIGVYVYNQQGDGQVVMWGIEYVVGDDPETRGLATVGLALLFAAITAVNPVMGLFRKGAAVDDDE